ncbi:MAG TPA: hypothetical protein VLT84_09220 [Acidobacteriota bacterium]|nr:hypothetical protein [Acidobacteriota bacterium]
MKRFVPMALALLIAAPVSLAAEEEHPAKRPPVPAFESLKLLVGDWQGTGDEHAATMKTSFHLTARGSVLVEDLVPMPEGAMTNVYHLDHDAVVMTHYCGAGNQPRMRGTMDGKDIKFVMTDISNWKKGEARMTAVTITVVDADHMKQTWTSETEGRSETFTMEFVRKKS